MKLKLPAHEVLGAQMKERQPPSKNWCLHKVMGCATLDLWTNSSENKLCHLLELKMNGWDLLKPSKNAQRNETTEASDRRCCLNKIRWNTDWPDYSPYLLPSVARQESWRDYFSVNTLLSVASETSGFLDARSNTNSWTFLIFSWSTSSSSSRQGHKSQWRTEQRTSLINRPMLTTHIKSFLDDEQDFSCYTRTQMEYPELQGKLFFALLTHNSPFRGLGLHQLTEYFCFTEDENQKFSESCWCVFLLLRLLRQRGKFFSSKSATQRRKPRKYFCVTTCCIISQTTDLKSRN